ncbi:MAG: type II toxin-antitoxin system PemK/MazF family toxin [Candidatus Methanomethylicaceae archaeon]
MKRGEVWWANLPAPIGRRPVTLVSRNEAYKVRDLIMIAPVTTRVRNIPTEVELGPKDGLPRRCVINCDSLVTIPKARLQSRITALNPAKVRELNQAIKFALGLP